MKRLAGSDSMGALMSICPNSTDEANNPMFTRGFQTMMDGGGGGGGGCYDDEENCMDQESCQLLGSEKKRRLSVDQVKALEKNFEVENKLEPERKVKLAQELGLQPRQVAVWFQNRRARWKTKQLERDYGVLKASYDGLKLDFDKLQRDNEALIKEISELKSKSKFNEASLKEEEELMSDAKLERSKQGPEEVEAPVINKSSGQIKDPSSSDSCDSSAILNEDVNVGGTNGNNMNFQFQDSKVASVVDYHHQQQQQFVKIEEHNFFGEESCSTLFSDDQAPSLHWYEWS